MTTPFLQREQFHHELGKTSHSNELVLGALFLDDDLHERGVGGLFHIISTL